MPLTRLLTPLAAALAALGLWQGLILLTGLPPYLLPGPLQVGQALLTHRLQLAQAALHTGAEILGGFGLGSLAGALIGLLMAAHARAAQMLRPVLLLSQIIPIFTLAPILTLWLGYGMAPKITVAALICFFPVASAFFDGLGRCPQAALDIARSMQAPAWRVLWHIRIPLALPMLGSGLRLAAVAAPVGAVIGEWVGGSQGLGAVMIHANGRMRIDLTFAALVLVTLMSLCFYKLVDALLQRALARFTPA